MRNSHDRPTPRTPRPAGLASHLGSDLESHLGDHLDAATRAYEAARHADDPVASRHRTAASRRVYAALAREAERRGADGALRAARRWYQDVPLLLGAPAERRADLRGEAEALERVLEIGGLDRAEIARLARIRPRYLEPGFVVS